MNYTRHGNFLFLILLSNLVFLKRFTSSFLTKSFAVGADIIIWRALGLMKPSSTALSINDSKEL